MLKVWLTTSDNTSWKTLKDALKSRSVGASQLAGVLETKYSLVEGTEVASTSDVDVISPPPPELKQMVPQPRVTDAQASEFKYTHQHLRTSYNPNQLSSFQVLPLTLLQSLVTQLLPRLLPAHNLPL